MAKGKTALQKAKEGIRQWISDNQHEVDIFVLEEERIKRLTRARKAGFLYFESSFTKAMCKAKGIEWSDVVKPDVKTS